MTRSTAARRPEVLFVTWSFVQGRSVEIADALGGEVCAIYPRRLDGARLAPVRYAVSAARTVVSVVARRPRSIIVTNPPIFPAMICWAYGRLTGTPVLLDSHPGSFGRKDNKVAQRFLPVHRWLAARSSAVLVTTDDWVDTVQEWGGTGVVVHEAPPSWEVAGPHPLEDPMRVLFVGIFANDEPVAAVIEATRRLDGVVVEVTGDVRRAPAGIVDSAPSNVRFVGYLGPEDYRAAVERADVVLALTTEPTSVMRAAYEGVYARRPIVISDWPALRDLFPDAVFVSNDADGIEAGLADARERHAELISRTEHARVLQQERWDRQVARIRELADLGPSSSAGPDRADDEEI